MSDLDQAAKVQEFEGSASRRSFAGRTTPLPMHPYAEKAAEAACCAGTQGKFWEFHDLLFVAAGRLAGTARTLNLDQERFDKCLVEGVEAAAVEKDAEEAKSLGITGTQSFFINGHSFSGVLTYAALHDMVEQQLAKSPSLAKRVTPLESTSK